MLFRMSLVVSIMSALVLAFVAQAEPQTESDMTVRPPLHRSSLDWIQTEKIRAGYMNRWNSEELPGKLAAAGFNTMHVQFCHGGHGDIKRWGRLARESGLRLFTSIWWGYAANQESRIGKPSGIGKRYRGFVLATGRRQTRTVCPTDERYWDAWITPDMIEMAKQARAVGITGITIDPESYRNTEPDGGVSYVWYYYGGMCFCEYCFGDFLTSIGAAATPDDVPPGNRKAWLKQRDHLGAYETNLKENVQVQARRVEQAVHAIDPDVLLGFLAVYGADDFFFAGLRDGFGTPERPVTIWTETPTYKHGYHPYVDEVYSKLRSIGDVIYIPGLYLEAHAPMTLEDQSHALAAHSDGYWVFTRKKNLLMNATIVNYFKKGNGFIDRGAPSRDEAPFVDLWDAYDPVLTLPAWWRFRLDPEDVGKTEAWFAGDVDKADWRGLAIADFWDKSLDGPYAGAAWYRTAVNVPSSAAGRKLYLVFGAVDEEAWVWVNGEMAGEHAKGPEGWNQRFLIEVTEQLEAGQKNVIAVRVYNSIAAGGIWKPVRLIARK